MSGEQIFVGTSYQRMYSSVGNVSSSNNNYSNNDNSSNNNYSNNDNSNNYNYSNNDNSNNYDYYTLKELNENGNNNMKDVNITNVKDIEVLKTQYYIRDANGDIINPYTNGSVKL